MPAISEGFLQRNRFRNLQFKATPEQAQSLSGWGQAGNFKVSQTFAQLHKRQLTAAPAFFREG
jgi:hypothetical protein